MDGNKYHQSYFSLKSVSLFHFCTLSLPLSPHECVRVRVCVCTCNIQLDSANSWLVSGGCKRFCSVNSHFLNKVEVDRRWQMKTPEHHMHKTSSSVLIIVTGTCWSSVAEMNTQNQRDVGLDQNNLLFAGLVEPPKPSCVCQSHQLLTLNCNSLGALHPHPLPLLHAISCAETAQLLL